MNGDLIIKDVDLEQLEEDLDLLEEVFEEFENRASTYAPTTDDAGTRVLGMLKTWAEGRKAEREDVELATKITFKNVASEEDHLKRLYMQGVLAGLKEQRKRLGK